MSHQNLNAREVFMWLLENSYLEGADTPSGNQLTNQFFKDAAKELYVSVQLPSLIVKQELVLPATKQEWEMKFIDLIKAAQIPVRIFDSKGDPYYANKFSETGLKVFQKALQSGVIYEVLVKSVMLYYKSSVKYKKTVGNYFRDGDWRTDYEALLLTAEEGADAMTDHIKEQIKPNSNERSNYDIG